MAIVHNLMSKMLADVDVLGALPAADDIVPPFDTRCVVGQLSSYIGVGCVCVKPMRSRRLRRYSTSVVAVDAE